MSDNNTSHSPPIKELGGAHVFLSISAVIISIMAVTCNCLLICVIVRSRLLKTPTNMFIASLAVGELLTGVFGIPFAAASVLASDWPFSLPLCEMSASLQVIGRSSSTYSLMAICVDRWLAVSRPLKYSHMLTLKSSSITLACIWLLAAVVGLLPLGPWGCYRYATDYYLCTLFKTTGQQQHLVKEVICSYLPASVICLTILLIIKEIKSHHRIFAIVQLPLASTSDPARDLLPGFIPGPRGFNRNTSKAMRSLFIIIGGYAAFCLPLSVLNIFYQNRYPELTPRAVVTSVVWVSFLCCVINPVIIILFNRKFRAQLKILVNQHLCPPVAASKEVFTVSTGLQHVLEATLVLNMIKHENASTTASTRRKVLRLGAPKELVKGRFCPKGRHGRDFSRQPSKIMKGFTSAADCADYGTATMDNYWGGYISPSFITHNCCRTEYKMNPSSNNMRGRPVCNACGKNFAQMSTVRRHFESAHAKK